MQIHIQSKRYRKEMGVMSLYSNSVIEKVSTPLPSVDCIPHRPVDCNDKFTWTHAYMHWFYCNFNKEAATKHTPPKGPSSTLKLSCGTGAAGAIAKDPITKLKEYCDKNKLHHKYEEIKCGGHQFQFRVRVHEKTYVGGPQSKKQDARKSAAQKALKGMKL